MPHTDGMRCLDKAAILPAGAHTDDDAAVATKAVELVDGDKSLAIEEDAAGVVEGEKVKKAAHQCTVTEVEETKAFIRILPIFL